MLIGYKIQIYIWGLNYSAPLFMTHVLFYTIHLCKRVRLPTSSRKGYSEGILHIPSRLFWAIIFFPRAGLQLLIYRSDPQVSNPGPQNRVCLGRIVKSEGTVPYIPSGKMTAMKFANAQPAPATSSSAQSCTYHDESCEASRDHARRKARQGYP